MDLKDKSIIFFDGYCVLCNGFINFLLSCKKRKKTIYFASLQGITAKELQVVPKEPLLQDSIIFYDRGHIFERSEAVINIMLAMGGVWRSAALARFIPLFLRNFIYKVIATNRYRWFGKLKKCRLPTKKEQQFFLL